MTTMAMRRVCTIAAVGLAMLGATIGSTPASAKPSKPGKPGTGAGNCVIELVSGSTKPESTTCFEAFDQAISFASQGRITDATELAAGPDTDLDRRIQESNQAAAVSPNALFVLSIEYFDAAGLGPALVFLGATQCSPSLTDIDYEFILAPADWDQISSYYTSYCDTNHFYLENFSSANTGLTFCGLHHCPILTMNPGNLPGDNNTRALRWS